MKVALVHDWLTGMRGGERCLEEFLRIYPQAEIYTMIHVPGTTSDLIDRHVKQTSFLQKLPLVHKYYRWLLPIYPFAVRSLKISDCDLVISLNHAAAKNVTIPKGAKHVCFCFTPMRYIWDQVEKYFGILRFVIYPIIFLLRKWDQYGAKRVDCFVAISKFVAARIRSFYHVAAKVIYPPIMDNWSEVENRNQESDYFLYAGAIVPYKNVDSIIEAFNRLGDKLIIAGTGPNIKQLQAKAKNNIEFLGRVSDQELKDLYANCRALIFAAKEDFGLTPIECLATGKPVIAAYCGALKESLNNIKYWETEGSTGSEVTGVFYRYDLDSLVNEIVHGVEFFKNYKQGFLTQSCKSHAMKFSTENFKKQWGSLIEGVV